MMMDNCICCEDRECPVHTTCALYIDNLDWNTTLDDVTGYRPDGSHSCPMYHVKEYKERR